MDRILRGNRFCSLSGTELKRIALISMLVDHIGFLFIPPGFFDFLFRFAGRMAFPLYAFLLVEGFLHTGDRKAYKKNMLLFAFVSEIPFDLVYDGTWFYPAYQNVFVTLFLGLCLLEQLELRRGALEELMLTALFAVIAWVLNCDYQGYGILLIYLFFRYRRGYCSLLEPGFFTAFMSVGYYFAAALAMIPIYYYNGTRGSQRGKYVYYFFYPIHLFFLYLGSLLI